MRGRGEGLYITVRVGYRFRRTVRNIYNYVLVIFCVGERKNDQTNKQTNKRVKERVIERTRIDFERTVERTNRTNKRMNKRTK